MAESLSITPEQRRQYDEDGFFLVEDRLDAVGSRRSARRHRRGSTSATERSAIWGRTTPSRCATSWRATSLFRRMIDHPKMLPIVVDVLEVNIQLRTSHMDVRPSQEPEAGEFGVGAPDSFFPWHSDGPNGHWPTVEGRLPYMEMKVGYYLTDLTQPNSGAICVVRGSHNRAQPVGDDKKREIDPDDIVEVNVEPGTALVWRTALLHALTPNLSGRARKCLYYGYQHRWIRPGDYDHQPASLLEGRTPIQRQLLGELGNGERSYDGDDAEVQPVSKYWRPDDEDIPLKAWAQERGLQMS